jgi:deoxycytidine triphosphate deaminase
MRLCKKNKLIDLIEEGKLKIEGVDVSDVFLDDLRVALRLRPQILEARGIIDLVHPDDSNWNSYNLSEVALMPNRFYLASSVEMLSLPNNMMGLICTRSKYARLGLELAQSSVFVIPGFGSNSPAPLVFEIYPRVELRGLKSNFPYGFLLFFELDEDIIRADDLNYASRFPLSDRL